MSHNSSSNQFKFTAEHFPGTDVDGISDSYIPADKVIELANIALQAYLESCPVVYGKFNHMPEGVLSDWCYRTTNKQYDEHTHKARLVAIELIKREPCKHVPRTDALTRLPIAECGKCGVPLVATWKAKESK